MLTGALSSDVHEYIIFGSLLEYRSKLAPAEPLKNQQKTPSAETQEGLVRAATIGKPKPKSAARGTLEINSCCATAPSTGNSDKKRFGQHWFRITATSSKCTRTSDGCWSRKISPSVSLNIQRSESEERILEYSDHESWPVGGNQQNKTDHDEREEEEFSTNVVRCYKENEPVMTRFYARIRIPRCKPGTLFCCLLIVEENRDEELVHRLVRERMVKKQTPKI